MSEALLAQMRRPPRLAVDLPVVDVDDPLTDDDLHLSLYACYELHYRGLDGVDEGWEWEPSLLAARRLLERSFEAALLEESGGGPTPAPVAVADELRAIIAGGGGPSLSSFVEQHASLAQVQEFAVHRSAYQLKEADPHTFGIPRLSGRSKAAMVTIQADEYGGGQPDAMHASLFAVTMEGLGLSSRYGAYVDVLPGSTLATCNLVTLFGLHRRWRGALVGHLALFEMTSVTPMGRYSRALRRLGLPEAVRRFYDVHVLADAEHEVIAADDLAAGLVADEPDLTADVCFGARALMAVEGRFARSLLDAWARGESSLRAPIS